MAEEEAGYKELNKLPHISTKLGGPALCGGHLWIAGKRELLRTLLPMLSVNKTSGLC